MNSTDPTPVSIPPPQQQGFLPVCKAVLIHPRSFFDNLPLDTPLNDALKFLALILAISSVGHLLDGGVGAYFSALVGNVATQIAFVVALTLMAKVFGGPRDFGNMLRACCYASAPLLLHILPIVGLIGNAYGLYLLFLGVQRTQKLDRKNSIFTVASACVCCLAVSALWHMIFHGRHR